MVPDHTEDPPSFCGNIYPHQSDVVFTEGALGEVALWPDDDGFTVDTGSLPKLVLTSFWGCSPWWNPSPTLVRSHSRALPDLNPVTPIYSPISGIFVHAGNVVSIKAWQFWPRN